MRHRVIDQRPYHCLVYIWADIDIILYAASFRPVIVPSSLIKWPRIFSLLKHIKLGGSGKTGSAGLKAAAYDTCRRMSLKPRTAGMHGSFEAWIYVFISYLYLINLLWSHSLSSQYALVQHSLNTIMYIGRNIGPLGIVHRLHPQIQLLIQ